MAQALLAAGLQPGDRVAVWLPNSAEAAVAIWAAWQAGGVVVPLHAAAKGDALTSVARDAVPAWLLASTDLAAGLAPLRDALPDGARVVLIGDPARLGRVRQAGDLEWTVDGQSGSVQMQAAATATPSEPDFSNAAQDDDELAALIYTSGSTGEPKGVMLTQGNMTAALRAVNAYLRLTSSDVIYSALPLSSSYGLYQLVLGLALGATTVLDRSFAFPTRSMQLIAAERCSVVAAVPTMFAWLASTPTLDPFDLSSLRVLTSAAAALPVEHARRVVERLPQARLFVMYGQTECKRISYLEPDDFARKAGSVGRGMPFQRHLLLGEDGEVVQGPGSGELVVQGPHVMKGYFRRPEASAQKLKPVRGQAGIWLHTGDLFEADAEGYLFFQGRQDDILKVGGHKVSPREVEEVLCSMPQVREAAVTGMADPVWGEAVRAHIVLRDGQSVSADEVIRFCSSRLRGYMVPKAVQVLRDLPKTESGKIKKRELL